MMDSIAYTVNLVGGFHVHKNIEEALCFGQELLKERLEKAKSLLDLVDSTAPQWQTECRWEALRCLRRFLEQYDPLHFAHKGPDDLFYPILISPPEGLQGIDCCLFYLNILWIENQIMAGIPEDVLEQFWDALPSAALNPCEYLLLNGIGKSLLGTGLSALTFTPEEYALLFPALLHATEESLQTAAKQLSQWLNLQEESAKQYVIAAVSQLVHWTGDSVRNCDLENLFL
jgi:hypothetical protein